MVVVLVVMDSCVFTLTRNQIFFEWMNEGVSHPHKVRPILFTQLSNKLNPENMIKLDAVICKVAVVMLFLEMLQL